MLNSYTSLFLGYLVIIANATKEQNKPSSLGEKHWNPPNENLSLVYDNGHLAAYFDSSVSSDIGVPLVQLSKAWGYVKDIYGHFGPDPLLYLIVQGKERLGCTAGSFIQDTYENRNVIDCAITALEKGDNSNNTAKTWNGLLNTLGKIIYTGAKGMLNNADDGVCGMRMIDILIYDLYLHVMSLSPATNHEVELFKDIDVTQWKEERLEVTHGSIFWFRDWFLPIYEKYGGASAIDRYYTYTYGYWKRNQNGGYKFMNLGEFVHFWSGAVGEDLLPLATSVFYWTEENSKQLEEAKAKYPYLSSVEKMPPKYLNEYWLGHREYLTLVHYDDHVAAYVDNNKGNTSITWPFSFLSKAWKHVKDTYGSFGPDPRLYFVMHAGKPTGCTGGNFASSIYSHNTIDCGTNETNSTEWNQYSFKNLQTMLNALGFIVKKGVKGIFNIADFQVCGRSMMNMIVYDILLHLKGDQNNTCQCDEEQKYMESNVTEWKMTTLKKELNGKFWFRDWFLPIYEGFGGASVLDKFYNYTHAHWKREYYGSYASMNIGEFIHFWSGAAEVDLLPLALLAFPWTNEDHKKLSKARIEYPFFSYLPLDAMTETPTRLIIKDDDFPGKFQILHNVYTDPNIQVYYDPNMAQEIEWPFQLLSSVWQHLNSKYPDILELNKILGPNHFVFRARAGERANQGKICEPSTSFTLESKKDIKDGYGYLGNLVDCKYPQGSLEDIENATWANDSSGNVEIIMKSFLMLLNKNDELNETQNLGKSSLPYIVKIIIYDLYKKIGRDDDAENYMENVGNFKISSLGNKDWIKDWYFPIYDYQNLEKNNDGNDNETDTEIEIAQQQEIESEIGADILNKFVWLLNSTGIFEAGIERDLNVGEFVHLWSGAAKRDLKDLAVQVFGWNQVYQDELEMAREEFPGFEYTPIVPEPGLEPEERADIIIGDSNRNNATERSHGHGHSDEMMEKECYPKHVSKLVQAVLSTANDFCRSESGISFEECNRAEMAVKEN